MQEVVSYRLYMYLFIGHLVRGDGVEVEVASPFSSLVLALPSTSFHLSLLNGGEGGWE